MREVLNRAIIYLILFDFLFQTAWGLISPFFSVFIVQKVKGGSLSTVGIAVAIYWIVKSAIQPIIAYFADLKKGEKDDFSLLFFGMVVVGFIPLGYYFSSHILYIFLLEFIRALAMACVVPIWSGFFTRHLTKGWESFSWSLDSTIVGLALGFSAFLGGMISYFFGFNIIFLFASLLNFLTLILLILLKRSLKIN